MRRFRAALAAHILFAATPKAQLAPHPSVHLSWRDVGPDSSSSHVKSPDAASGGRVNGLAMSRDKSLTVAASEWGGLWRSLDTGRTWRHVDAHLPVATWQVAIDPTNAKRVYATSFYDGRVQSFAGINVSVDGGRSWTHPSTADPAPGACADSSRVQNPSAFGIAIAPHDPRRVAVGTNCGLILSTDAGVTWRRVYPAADNRADVWSVVINGSGIIDLCGDGGHSRSTDGGAHWSTAVTQTLPAGQCSIAASPTNPDVLIATVRDTSLYESLDGGGSWHQFSAGANHPDVGMGRISSVSTNARSDSTFDLWYGYAGLYRGACPLTACSARFEAQGGNFWTEVGLAGGAHLDIGVVLFDPAAPVDACPLLLSNDGGIERNTVTTSPACHSPHWVQPDTNVHALWVLGMKLTQDLLHDPVLRDSTRAIVAGPSNRVNAYHRIIFGTQDNGSFQTDHANATILRWLNTDPADVSDVAGDDHITLNSVCCYADGNELFLRFLRRLNTGMILADTAARRLVAPRGTRVLFSVGAIALVAPYRFAILTDSGLYVSRDVRKDTARYSAIAPDSATTRLATQWTALGWPVPRLDRSTLATLTVSFDSAAARVEPNTIRPVFFVRIDSAGAPSQFYRLSGVRLLEDSATLGNWQRVVPPGNIGGFGIVNVDRAQPRRLFASQMRPGRNPRMIRSIDGGASWVFLPGLDTCMTRNGTFRYTNVRGPTGIGTGKTGFSGYAQPTLVAFGTAAENGRLLIAGAADAGIFISLDAGASWRAATDPFTPQLSGIPHIPRPLYAKVVAGQKGTWAFVGSQGRGPWSTFVPRGTAIKAAGC